MADVISELNIENTLIINAPPGAGKSTLLPIALLKTLWLQNKKIILLEPRRLAARTVAERMAFLLNEDVGKTIGYKIRFESKTSNETKIEVVTEGVLTRMMQTDTFLESYACVIFDEFHERSINTDLALALCRDLQKEFRPDLKLIIMSATINSTLLKDLLNAKEITSLGKNYAVDINYSPIDADAFFLPESVLSCVNTAIKKHQGDILIFLPGEGEIKKCFELLKKHLQDTLIYPLYSKLSRYEQQQAIIPNKNGIRKIVLATSIAETSLTIEGIKIVIDTGFAKSQKFDVSSGLSKLTTHRISKDRATQRSGRAGRLSDGYCYRLWTKATHERLSEFQTPEILEADLSTLVLELKNWGEANISNLTWLNQPPKAAVNQATDLLMQLGAIENNKITPHGKLMLKFPAHPRISHMLLSAKSENQKALACDVAALIEERDILQNEQNTDINLRVEYLRRQRKNQNLSKSLLNIEKISAQYRSLINTHCNNNSYDVNDVGFLIAMAYPERVASARPGNNAQFQLVNGKIAMLKHNDSLAHEPWIAISNLDMREGLGKIFSASPLNPIDLKDQLQEEDIVEWDIRKGKLISQTNFKLGSIILGERQNTKPSPEKIELAIKSVIKNNYTKLLNLNDDFEQLRNRIKSIIAWNNDSHWPKIRNEDLFTDNIDWLYLYLNNCKTNEDFKKINIAECLYNSLSYEQQRLLNELVPGKIKVPSGSFIKIEYYPNGEQATLKVRLQEIFGWKETPTINNNKNKILIHLLSPGYKPVQITSDLKSFWNNLYFETRNELKRRYPKHSWPEDPLYAVPVKKGKSEK